MSKLRFALALGFITATSMATVEAAEYKIGVVQLARVLQASPQAEAAGKKLEAEFGTKQKALAAKEKELKAMEDRAAKDGAIMSESERGKLERDALNLRRELKRDSDEFRDDVNFRRNEEMGKVQKVIGEAIQSLATEKEFDLVLGDGVFYASKAVDITDLVIEKLKKSSK